MVQRPNSVSRQDRARRHAPEQGRGLAEVIESSNQSTSARQTHDLNVGIFLWPEFPLLSLAGLIDALRHAADMGDNSQKLRCSWTVMGRECGSVTKASSGVEVRAESAFLDATRFHYIAVIGGLLRSMGKGSPDGRRYLRRAREAGVPLIGICTGSFLLAEEGMLNGRRACLHPYHFAEFKERFTRVNAVTDLDFIDDGDMLTCAGGISVISLATHLIARHCGPDRATKAIHQMSVPNKADAVPVAVSQAIGYTRVADARLRRAVFLLEQSLLQPISTDWLAAQVGVSRRQLSRLFIGEFNQSPGEFVRTTRLRVHKVVAPEFQ